MREVWQRIKHWCITLMNETHWGDILTFLFFVLLATVLWYGHAMHSVRNATIPVLVTYTGIPANVGVDKKHLPDTLLVEVRDAGKRLRTYHSERPQLTIDLSSQVHGSQGTIRISADVLRRSISDMLQGTSKLQSVTPEQIVCDYHRQEEWLLPIEWDGTVVPADEYQLVGEPQLSAQQVRIYGRKAALDTIEAIHTELLGLTDLKDTTVARLALIAPRGVRLGADSVSLTIVTERYTEKAFVVPITVQDVPEGEFVRLFPQTTEVTVRVGMSHFGEVEANDVMAQCHYPENGAETLGVEVRYTNPYILSARAYPNEVEFIVER